MRLLITGRVGGVRHSHASVNELLGARGRSHFTVERGLATTLDALHAPRLTRGAQEKTVARAEITPYLLTPAGIRGLRARLAQW